MQKKDEDAVGARYTKAKFVCDCLTFPNYKAPWLNDWYDSDFGHLEKPEDAFEIWWDV